MSVMSGKSGLVEKALWAMCCLLRLLRVQIELPRTDLYLPTNPSSRVLAAIPESATPMQSAAKVPILVAFLVSTPGCDTFRLCAETELPAAPKFLWRENLYYRNCGLREVTASCKASGNVGGICCCCRSRMAATMPRRPRGLKPASSKWAMTAARMCWPCR